MNNLCRGIFWIKCIKNFEAIVIKAECDSEGVFMEIPHGKLLSKNGRNFNHQSVWRTLSKNITESKPYNYYPRGRVEIRHGKAIIFANGNIADEKLRDWAIGRFNLTEENGINSVVIKADMSRHYFCFMDKCKSERND